MIRFESNQMLLVILEPANLEAIRQNHPLVVENPMPTKMIVITMVPDMAAFEKELKKLPQPVNVTTIIRLLEKSENMPEVMRDTKWVKIQ